MIGGEDILIRTCPGPAAMEFAIRTIRRQWPSAIFEDAQTGESLQEVRLAGLSNRCEVLAYKDRAWADQWRDQGADESLTGTMIHLLISEDGLTAVVDADPPAEVRSVIDSIRRGLRQDLFGVKAETRSAA